MHSITKARNNNLHRSIPDCSGKEKVMCSQPQVMSADEVKPGD